jgi:hypothetical protein
MPVAHERLRQSGFAKTTRRAVAQYVFGQIQVIGAIVGLCLLVADGPTAMTIIVIAATLVVSLTSRLLFHRGK